MEGRGGPYLSRWLSLCLGARAFSKNISSWASESGDTEPCSLLLLPMGSPDVGRARAVPWVLSVWGRTGRGEGESQPLRPGDPHRGLLRPVTQGALKCKFRFSRSEMGTLRRF